MKPSFARSNLAVRGEAAFTLIELLAVMAIILVLAGLILNIAGNANYNSAKARATTELKTMETSLETYKSDNGAYPSDPSTTEMLDPRTDFDQGQQPLYAKSSEFLYQALAGWTPSTTSGGATTFTVGKKYMDFTPSQLHVASDNTSNSAVPSNTSPYMYLVDPFGFSYGYSTAYAAAYYKDATKTPTVGYNPTFDLWSTAGYSTGGKKTPSNMQGADAATKYSTLWVKNW